MCEESRSDDVDPRARDATAVTGARFLTAVTVMRDGTAYMMCPFFGKCDGFLVVDPLAAKVKYIANPERTADAICRAIVSCGAVRLICGFVPAAECRKLQAAGIDVRLGSCASDVEDLVAEFDKLPRA